MISRRHILAAGAALAGSTSLPPHITARAASLQLDPALPEGTRAIAALEALPGKKPLIRLSYRPPNYEAPIGYFRTPITPNDEFFVRYHLADIPEVDAKILDPRTWRLSVGGEGAEKTVELTLDDLKAMPAVELVAVNQCSGNRRGLFQPHVPGVEWGYGAMGCARWKGARLKDILDKVGLKKEAIEIAFDGADKGVFDKVPDFVKSVPTWKAIEDTTIVAYEMNGVPLPHLNGFPARLVLPGWTGTYWMKHLISITALVKPLGNFWMATAYRVPLGKFPLVARFTSQETAANTPITEMVVNSLITSHADGASVKAGTMVGGLAWDGGYGITSVDVSMDGGKSWMPSTLGEDLGRFAFRPFSAPVHGNGKVIVMARATNKIGQTQTAELNFNPAGYHHNVIHRITLNVS
jgi:DMSO/TMAO reductase YedYZ molybdopterin-dependent catalytic subunit